jgi:inositol 1,4,5-triphosphate receptor type 1/inositol 1,4,5-triphosphate receptor type 3
MEVFDHIKEDPRETESKYPDGYFETIIQNGFYIFFLMSYYRECDPHMDN